MQARVGSVTATRRIRLALAIPLVFVVMTMTFASNMTIASAHAVVTSSKPSDGEQLKTAPAGVTINFSENVSSDLGGLKVLDSTGNRVDQNDSSQPTPSSLYTTLKPGLSDGTFVANYKVVSADGHAISGAIVFAVGNTKIGNVAGLEAKNDPKMETLSKVGQFLTYLGALLAAGLAFFLAFVHDGADDRFALQAIARWSTIGAAFGVVVTILAQAALATGSGLGSVFQSGTLGPVLREGLGWSAAVLLVGLAAVHLSVDMKRGVAAQSLAFYGGIAATGSFVLWGHATESDKSWLTVPADVVHVACGAAWFGGLVGLLFMLRARRANLVAATAGSAGRSSAHATPALSTSARATEVVPDPPSDLSAAGEGELGGGAVALLTRPTDDPGTFEPADGADVTTPSADSPANPGDLAGNGTAPRGSGDDEVTREPGSFASTVHTVLRFSNLAAISVILLVIAGTALAYSELGSFSALLTTTYGITLTIKIAVVAVVLFMAGYNRYFLLPWLLVDDGGEDDDAATAPCDGVGVGPATALLTTEFTTDLPTGPPTGDAVSADLLAPVPATHDTAGALALTTATATPTDVAAEGWRILIRTLMFEALGIVAILMVTAVLVNLTPGVASEVNGPFQSTQPFRSGHVALTIAPNTPGPNNFHLDFTGADGKASDEPQKVTLMLSLPEKDLGPFTREFVKGGTGHYILENVNDIAIAGNWQVTLLVQVSDFEQERVEFQDKVK